MRCLRKDCVRESVSGSIYCDQHKLLPDIVLKFDANLSLDDLAQSLDGAGNANLVGVVSFERAEDHNLVYFEHIEPQDLSPIILIEIKSGESAQALKAQQLAEGKKFIFQGHVLVVNKDTEILAFR